MNRLTEADRQQIIDHYLEVTQRESYVPREFMEWVREQGSDHPAFHYLFPKSQAEMADLYSITLARRFASGLRIVIRRPEVRVVSAGRIVMKQPEVVETFPRFHSMMDGRPKGGGSLRFDPNNPEMMKSLCREGRLALARWIERYGSAAERAGVDLAQLRIAEGQMKAAAFQEAAE